MIKAGKGVLVFHVFNLKDSVTTDEGLILKLFMISRVPELTVTRDSQSGNCSTTPTHQEK